MSDAMHATYANNDALAAEVQRLRAALAAVTADRDAVLKANGALNQELRAMQAQRDSDRLGTHWAGCWRDGGRRHWQCAVAEAERQMARADAAETKLAAVPVEALRRYLRYSQVPDHHHRYDAAEQQADEAAITAWLAQQNEVQP